MTKLLNAKKGEKCSYNGGGDTIPLKTWSHNSSLQYVSWVVVHSRSAILRKKWEIEEDNKLKGILPAENNTSIKRKKK